MMIMIDTNQTIMSQDWTISLLHPQTDSLGREVSATAVVNSIAQYIDGVDADDD